MSFSKRLKKEWDEYRLARQYLSQGERLENVAATRILTCPKSRCKSPLKYDPHVLGFKCTNEKCGYREGTVPDKYIKPHEIPPSGSDYWIVTVDPPYWFYVNEFKV